MTQEQRRQAAAVRCENITGTHHSHLVDAPSNSLAGAYVNAILQLDELALMVIERGTSSEIYDIARQHILPEPKPSPVERLARALSPDNLSATTLNGLIGQLHLKLVEVDPSDDQ